MENTLIQDSISFSPLIIPASTSGRERTRAPVSTCLTNFISALVMPILNICCEQDLSCVFFSVSVDKQHTVIRNLSHSWLNKMNLFSSHHLWERPFYWRDKNTICSPCASVTLSFPPRPIWPTWAQGCIVRRVPQRMRHTYGGCWCWRQGTSGGGEHHASRPWWSSQAPRPCQTLSLSFARALPIITPHQPNPRLGTQHHSTPAATRSRVLL